MNGTIVGIDLAGPSNAAETAVAVFRSEDDVLQYERFTEGSDIAIRELICEEAERGPVAVGLDAPLSYQPGGGDRPRDSQLRRELVKAGLRPGSVMPPTMTRMAYLTLRGLAIARLLQLPGVEVVEVHPGAVLALRGAPISCVRSFRSTSSCRLKLLRWLETQGIEGLEAPDPCTSHFVAACAAALGTRDWRMAASRWSASAEPPLHPYDFAC